MDDVPSFLKARAKAAKDKAAQLRPKASQAAKAEPQPKPAVIPLKPNSKGVAKREQKQAAGQEIGGCEPVLADAAELCGDAIADLIVKRSADQEMAELARTHLAGVWSAIVVGAKIVGRTGNPDRQTLFKMLGLPWSNGGTKFEGGSAGSTDRLAAALNRLEQRLSGHEPVTVDAEIIAETSIDGAAAGVEHAMIDRLPLLAGGGKGVEKVEGKIGSDEGDEG